MVGSKRVQKIIAEVVEKIKTEYQPEKIILFGSYAYGKPNRDSDIDLFIVKDTEKKRIYRFAEVKKLVYDSKRRIPISPLVYTVSELDHRIAMGDQFIEEILTKGELLYAR
jgi:uncharacterized protein